MNNKLKKQIVPKKKSNMNNKKNGKRTPAAKQNGKSNVKSFNNKKTIIFLAILAICIYFIFALYGLIKEPTNIFMVENR